MKNITENISKTLREIAWKIGPRGIDGECCSDLTMPEYFSLEKISLSCDCSVQSIGEKLGFTKSGATRVVNRLEKKGYVIKKKSPSDGRLCCIELTDKGKFTLDMFNVFYLSKIEKGLEPLSENDLENFLKVLKVFQKNI